MVAIVRYLLIMWVCAGFGAWVLRRLRVKDATLAEELPFAAAIGMGALAYLILGIGLVGQLRLWAALLMLTVLAAIGWREMIRIARSLGGAAALRLRSGQASPPYSVAIFLLAIFLLTLIGALAPARDNDYDSLVYHLAMPKVYVRDASIHPVPWLTHSNFPFTLEMLYTVGLLAGDQSLAKLFHFGCGWLAALAVFGFARRWWGSLAGWVGAAIFAAAPLAAWQMMTAYIELGLALYAFLALAALGRARREPAEGLPYSPVDAGWLWVAALMCGWALGVKMLGGAALIFALVALLWGLRTAPERARAVGRIALFALIAAAIASPWYIKSYLWTGNPVYPFFYEVFDGKFWTSERARDYTAAQKAFGMGSGPLSFLLLPWNLTMQPRWFFDLPGSLREFNVYITVFGPAFLALLPTLILTGRVGPGGRLALWFALVFAVIWFSLTQNGRYLVPILPGLSACAGAAAARLLQRRWLLSSAAALVLGLSFVSGLVPAYMLAAPAARVALGMESQTDYLMRASPTYRLFHEVQQATPPSARIMLFGDEPRTFYLNRDCLLGDHAEIFSREDVASAPAFVAALERMGVTHLLLGPSVLQDMHSQRGLLATRLFDIAANGRMKLIGQYGPLTLWQIESAGRSSGS
jgi:4-amino-4-deoxy-L-arabinose transferase-like glycosyltransferase